MQDGDIISMQMKTLKLVQIVASAVVLTTAFGLPAAAKEHGHGHKMHRHYHHAYDRPLTVSKHRHPAPVVAADPFHGPAAIITGPNAIVATVVSLPFRAAEVVFPPVGNPAINPLVLVGAPVHLAGEIAQFPFYVVGSVFGAPPRIFY